MTETKFNSELRSVLRAQGLGVLHIREADQPGPTDLLIWEGRRVLAWAELKVGDNDTDPQQDQFIKAREAEGGNAYVLTLDPEGSVEITIWDPLWEGGDWVTLHHAKQFRRMDWRQFFIDNNRAIAEQS